MVWVACHLQEKSSPPVSKVKVFKLLLDTYVYNVRLGTFVPLPNMPAELPFQLCSAAKALQAIDQGKPDKVLLFCKFHGITMWCMWNLFCLE